MSDKLPLLIFPQHKSVPPESGRGHPPTRPTLPIHTRQSERLRLQLQGIRSEFEKFKGAIDQTIIGGEPELVVVLELAERIEDLERAVISAGLEWLGEWDADLEADEDFPVMGSKSSLDGRLFVSMINERGLRELLSLWEKWEKKSLPHGETKWRDIFACLKKIRRWGIQETLVETGMKEYFESLEDDESVYFQIECFYHSNQEKRRRVERNIQEFLKQGDGQTISDFLDMPDIAFHAVKARMPISKIRALLSSIIDEQTVNQQLFLYPSVMYFRYTGQSIVSNEDGEGDDAEYPQIEAEQPPIAAILDGVPNLQHKALRNLVNFDDPFDLADKYQPGERLHGTAMASLLIHGDRVDNTTPSIHSKVHHVAIMEPDKSARLLGRKIEYFPADCFFEDRIERAVRRILENDGEIGPLAPTVKIINLSLGDQHRPFIHTLSPWAKLLDWLSWKYRVLFCVSAGNYAGPYDFEISYSDYQGKNDEEKTQLLLEAIEKDLFNRRLLSPAESINALAVGALHQDESGNGHYLGQRIDILPDNRLISPISRLGHGFRRSVKPEIYFPGGRQLYVKPSPLDRKFKIHLGYGAPGQKVAYDSDTEGELSKDVFSRGTSNATALATRAGVQIHEVLSQMNAEGENNIPEELMAVLVKALLVHGSVQNIEVKEILEYLKNKNNSKIFKTVLARFLGYGAVDVKRVLSCTEQRGTVLGFGEIATDEMHKYRFPVPIEFGGRKTLRRMVVTLAWFSPINPKHRYYREAKLEVGPDEKWEDTLLRLKRTDADGYQVKRGTIQHEILEGKNRLAAFQQGSEIALQIKCKTDGTVRLDDSVPYGLAVTLEATEESQIPVYERIRERLSAQVQIRES